MKSEAIYQNYKYQVNLSWPGKISYPGISKIVSDSGKAKWVQERVKGEYTMKLDLEVWEYGKNWTYKESQVRMGGIKRPDYTMEEGPGYQKLGISLGDVQKDVDLVMLKIKVDGDMPESKFYSSLIVSYKEVTDLSDTGGTVLGNYSTTSGFKELDDKYVLIFRRLSKDMWVLDYDFSGDKSWKKRYLKGNVKP